MPYVVPGYWVPGYAVGDASATLSNDPSRTLGIGYEDRMLMIAAEDRRIGVDQEDRRLSIAAEDRALGEQPG